MEQEEISYLLVPGWRNSGPGHWQSLWHAELPRCSRLQQDNWEDPVPDHWVPSLDRHVAALPKPVILIAHSLGCHAVANWIPPAGHEVIGAVLVAPPVSNGRTPCSHIVERFQRPQAAGPLAFPSLLVASENDPYASTDDARRLAEKWQAEFVNAGAVGHINLESGHGPWSQGLELLNEFVSALRTQGRAKSSSLPRSCAILSDSQTQHRPL